MFNIKNSSQLPPTMVKNQNKNNNSSVLDVKMKYFNQGYSSIYSAKNFDTSPNSRNILLTSDATFNSTTSLPIIENNNLYRTEFKDNTNLGNEELNQKLVNTKIKTASKIKPIVSLNTQYLKTMETQSPKGLNKNYFSSDIFNSKQFDTYKSGEKYLFEKKYKIGRLINNSGSEWIPIENKLNLMNHSSVKYSILTPNTNNISKTKSQIFKECENSHHPGYFQKSISEFSELGNIYGPHKNPYFINSLNKSISAFNKKSSVCNNHYKCFKSYQGLISKPFTSNKFI